VPFTAIDGAASGRKSQIINVKQLGGRHHGAAILHLMGRDGDSIWQSDVLGRAHHIWGGGFRYDRSRMHYRDRDRPRLQVRFSGS
jgi:hypothetical protein